MDLTPTVLKRYLFAPGVTLGKQTRRPARAFSVIIFLLSAYGCSSGDNGGNAVEPMTQVDAAQMLEENVNQETFLTYA